MSGQPTEVTGAPGARDHLVTERLATALAALSPGTAQQQPLDPVEGPVRLARYLATILTPLLSGKTLSEEQAELINELLQVADGDMGGRRPPPASGPDRDLP